MQDSEIYYVKYNDKFWLTIRTTRDGYVTFSKTKDLKKAFRFLNIIEAENALGLLRIQQPEKVRNLKLSQ